MKFLWAAFLGGLIIQAKPLDVSLVLTQVPREVKAPPADWEAGGSLGADWFQGARVVVVSKAGAVRVLSEGFQSACDPSLSFDGARLLFAAKKERETRWGIWEIGLDGKNLRPVSPETQDARSPLYATTLFTLDSPEPWFTLVYVARESIVNEAGRRAGSSLYNVKLDGTEQRRLTYNPNHNVDPFQMWDGRLLYAAERYPLQPGAAAMRVGLHSIHIVGTEMVFYGGEAGRRFQRMPCATDQRRVVFIESDEVPWDGAGQLACIREQRPHESYQQLTSDPAWQYLYPAPLQGSRVLVSRRSANHEGTCGVYCFDVDARSCELVFESADYHDVQAQAVQPRPQPDGHSTVVEPAKYTTGIFYAMNCYDADEHMAPHLSPGVYKRVRVIEGTPVAAGETPTAGQANERKAPFVPRRILGEAPIEADGSLNIEVPADIPILLQPLDQRGLALGTCGWVWVKPRETRGCVGCHEDPELVPENAFVLALRRPSNKLAPPPSQRRRVDFRQDVVPILKQRCAAVGCHGMTDSPLYLPLMVNQPAPQDLQRAYAALRVAVDGGFNTTSAVPQPGKFIDAGRARTSPLVWRLFGTVTSRPWDGRAGAVGASSGKTGLMPPPEKGGPLSDEEIRTLIEWIDLGAAWETPPGSDSESSAGDQRTSLP